jgi:AcrR family transcriptional regulator
VTRKQAQTAVNPDDVTASRAAAAKGQGPARERLGSKERLSRETIVASALALADAEGLEAVTIRRVAQDLGVTPMALYWHFRDKDLLLDGIAERLLSEVVLPESEPSARWDERLRVLLDALLGVLRAHPAVAELVSTRVLSSVPGLELAERALGQIREGGFTADQAAQLGHHALSWMVLVVSSEPGRQVGEDALASEQRMRSKKAALQALAPEKYPNVQACSNSLVECENELDYYTLGLDLLIQGIRGVQPLPAI